MKILINTGLFNGGAPLSILEYAKIAQNNGHEVKAVGEYATSQVKYERLGIPTYNVPYFSPKRVFKNVIGLWTYSRIVNKEQPDIIHATSYGIVPSKFMSKLYGIPIMYSIAGGKTTGSIFDDEKLIVYSEENKFDLIKHGYDRDLIEVIPNRLSIEESSNPEEIYCRSKSDEINLLLISRLDKGVIESVYYVIDVVSMLSDKNQNISLSILGSGDYLESIRKIANDLNKTKQRKVIDVLGYQDDVDRYISQAHVVFGKGRSIVESILSNRISLVISESRAMLKCSVSTVDNLYRYNFSGRNMQCTTSIEELSEIINDIANNRVDLCELEEVRQFVDQRYNIKHVEHKINKTYEDRLAEQRTKCNRSSIVGALYFLLRVYFLAIYDLLRSISM